MPSNFRRHLNLQTPQSRSISASYSCGQDDSCIACSIVQIEQLKYRGIIDDDDLEDLYTEFGIYDDVDYYNIDRKMKQKYQRQL